MFGKSCASTKLRCEVEMIMITNRALIILVLCFLLCRTGRCDAKAPLRRNATDDATEELAQAGC